MATAVGQVSDYMKLYEYLPVMDGEQIWKLRKIAIGVLDMSAFSEEEIHVLETRLLVEAGTSS
jgi:hypothetical protein